MADDNTTVASDQQESHSQTGKLHLETPTNSGTGTPMRLRVKTLRAKTLLISVTTLLGLVVVLYLPLRILLPGSFLSLEQQDAFILSLLATGLVFGLVNIVLIERIVLSRLTKLSVDVRQISASHDLTARVAVAGKDEIAVFASTINSMLATLEQTQAERRLADDERAVLQEEMVRAREQFMQMVVHDLKTPLTALIGFLDFLNTTRMTDDQHEMINGARRSATGMNNLVATILDTGRLAEGRLKIRPEPTDIAALLHGCANDLSAWAEQDMHQIAIDLPYDLPPLLIDAGLTERVVINLLSNAIKHTPSGTTITLGAQVDDSGQRLWVHDDGPGIPPDQQQLLFERFGPSASRDGRLANTGLGLAFCKLAVEAHNGSVDAYSAPGHGTTFTITLPLATRVAEPDLASAAIYTGAEDYKLV